jgi:hypothetical protein
LLLIGELTITTLPAHGFSHISIRCFFVSIVSSGVVTLKSAMEVAEDVTELPFTEANQQHENTERKPPFVLSAKFLRGFSYE